VQYRPKSAGTIQSQFFGPLFDPMNCRNLPKNIGFYAATQILTEQMTPPSKANFGHVSGTDEPFLT
jgi:hypothetical protein